MQACTENGKVQPIISYKKPLCSGAIVSGRKHCNKAGADLPPMGGCSEQEDFFFLKLQ